MKIKKLALMAVCLSFFLAFNTFAMTESKDPYFPEAKTPFNEVKSEDRALNYGWTWLSDELCIQFKLNNYPNKPKERFKNMYDLRAVTHWWDRDADQPKKRDVYAGKWTQATDGIWSFEFDDKTIPVGNTKIDEVMYAFNGYGELQDGYEYYEGLKTGADGLANSDNPEYLKWLETQYIPACTSHE